MKDKSTLKWLYSHSRAQLFSVLFLSLLRSALTVLGVVFALTSRLVIDAAIAHDLDGLILSAAKLIAIILCQLLIRLLGQALEVRTSVRLQIKLRSRLFSSILKKDYSSTTAYHSGDLLTRLNNDISIISNGIMSLIPSVTALVIGLAYALYSLTKLDRNFAFIFFFGGILLVFVISIFRKLMKNLHKRVQESEAKTRSFFQESLGSLLMIKVFGIENKISEKARVLQNINYKMHMKRRNLSLISHTGINLVFSAGSLYALVWSAYRLFLGSITFGTLTAIIQLVNQIQSPFAGLSGVVPQYFSILASAERVIEIDSLPDEESLTPLDPETSYQNLKSISFEDISFGYDRDVILENANLTIDKGDFAVIAGISGIGKSTLIKLLLGVFSPSSGRICLRTNDENLPVGKYTRSLFSYVPQGNLLLSGTIRETLSLVNPEATDEEIMAAAEISCAAEFIKALPQGLDTYIGEKGAGLSEGQVQRLAVTRAILSGAPILLLDEATSALDEGTEEKLLNNIRNMQNKTCIIISHKRAAFDICNKHIYIEDKKIRTVDAE